MTDKELIKQEIERRMNLYDSQRNNGEKIDKISLGARIAMLEEIKVFIDSLPEESTDEDNCTTKNQDLDEELRKILNKHYYFTDGDDELRSTPELAKYIAYHFAEWQRQQMMKDAVELHIIESFNPVGTENEKPHGFTALCYNAKYPDFYPITGQTIKIIPIKEI